MFDLLAAPLMYASDLMNLVQTVVQGRILCWGAYCGSDLDVPKGGVVAHIVVGANCGYTLLMETARLRAAIGRERSRVRYLGRYFGARLLARQQVSNKTNIFCEILFPPSFQFSCLFLISNCVGVHL